MHSTGDPTPAAEQTIVPPPPTALQPQPWEGQRAGRDTGSILAARSDARSQEGKRSPSMPYRPASSAPTVPDGVRAEDLVWAETVAPGGYTHRRLRTGERVRLTDLSGQGCAHILLYNAHNLVERLNVADTMKIFWSGYLRPGHGLLSGDGRVLATLIADTSTHHDGFCGTSTAAIVSARYGAAANPVATPSGQDRFTVAAAKYGLTTRDIPPSLSFFKGVTIAADGQTVLDQDSFTPGGSVDLLIEMPVIMLLANVPHPLDDRSEYTSGRVDIRSWMQGATGPDSPWYTSSPEATRAYRNTEDYRSSLGEK